MAKVSIETVESTIEKFKLLDQEKKSYVLGVIEGILLVHGTN